MKVHKVEERMFVRAPLECLDNLCVGRGVNFCVGCAGMESLVLCQALPRCTGDKASIFKEVIYKEKQDA